MANVLVTGGAGFIGSHLVDELLKQSHRVVVLDDLSAGFRQNINRKAVFTKGSILDERLVRRLFKDYRFDFVFHLAAYAAEGLSHFIKRFNYNNNLIGSVNLINESVINKVKCFVFTSSIAVYGSARPPMREDMAVHPEDSYGIAKYAVEQELRISKEMFGLNYIIFRTHNVYGERQNIGDKYRNVIGIFMNQIMGDEPLSIFGDGKQTRAFTYIGDVAPLIASSVNNQSAYNQILNLGQDKPYSILELAELVSRAMGARPDFKYLRARKEVQHAYCDHTKAREVFKVSASTPLEEGLARMAQWAKKTGARKSKRFKDIEISENLPEGWLKG